MGERRRPAVIVKSPVLHHVALVARLGRLMFQIGTFCGVAPQQHMLLELSTCNKYKDCTCLKCWLGTCATGGRRSSVREDSRTSVGPLYGRKACGRGHLACLWSPQRQLWVLSSDSFWSVLSRMCTAPSRGTTRIPRQESPDSSKTLHYRPRIGSCVVTRLIHGMASRPTRTDQGFLCINSHEPEL